MASQQQQPRSAGNGSGPLSLPIASQAANNSLHLPPPDGAENQNKNGNNKPRTRTGFSLPLTNSNNLPSVLPPRSSSANYQQIVPNAAVTTAASANSSAAAAAQLAEKQFLQQAQSKRCRFALKDSKTYNTSTSSNASTVIEQPRGRGGHIEAENADCNNYRMIAESKISTVMSTNDNCSGGIPFKAPLMIEQAEEVMLTASKSGNGQKILGSMPRRPKGGTMFLIFTQIFENQGSDDGYMWTEILHQSDLVTSKDNHLDYRHYYISSSLGDGRRTRTSSKFRREAYTMGELTLLTYIGDEKAADGLDDRGGGLGGHQHDEIKPPPPPVSLQATTFNSLPRSHRYDKRPRATSAGLNNDHSSRRLHFARPRSLERKSKIDVLEHELQLKRLQAMRSPNNQLSIVMGPSSVQGELISLSEELASGKLVKNLTLFPSLQVTLVHPDMTREFEHACNVLYSDPMLYVGPSTITQPQDGLRLFYDITFPLGRIHVTLLTFVNACYEGHPIMPLAINIHERQFKSSHSLFWARVVGDIPALHKHRFPLIIDDAEPAVHLAVRAQAPNLVQLEGWSHRFRDIDAYLRLKGYGEEAINYFKACVCYLLNSPSKQAMHDRYRKEFEYVWPKDFVLYYRQRLLPRSGRLGKWAMAKLNICENQFLSPHTNPQERFHRLVSNFEGWESLSLEQMIRAFNYLFIFFINELSLRDTGNGAFVLKTAYQPHFHKFHHPRWQSHSRVPHPTEIAGLVARHYPVRSSVFFRPKVMAAAYSDATAFAASTDSYDDVLQMEEALDKMFRESEEEDAAMFNELIRINSVPTSVGPGRSSSASAGRATLEHHGQRERQARFQLGGANYSSSFSSNVPSPAPNGQVPSPAPEDQRAAAPPSVTLPPAAGQAAAPALNLHGSAISNSSGIGGGSIKGQQGAINPPNNRNPLSTIPEVSSQREGSLNNLNNNYPATSLTQNVNKQQPPDLLVHSGNWQEHSFDSSIVTEGHYDASFESEVPPNASFDINDAAMTSCPAAVASTKVTYSNQSGAQLRRPPPIAQSAKKNVFSVTGIPSTTVVTSGSTITTSSQPNSLMLWKKVQHYVVVGGAFVSSAAATTATAPSNTNTVVTAIQQQ